ncbi:LysR family transcriptional regulator [Curvibacter sp. APW13]|uniref:LysR family transcriptional regulator n=1 Tax=Curvibacter sp. APW13 TaxID=3077236 RepID=UPI0028DFD05D|nr:LysR family transcriptional regulator [Curvibacter sp. APW13]MDT8990238.1 LysR family transcriptional regulator [Curvibacter sp. APW13]
MLRNFDLNLLKVFDAVMNERNLTRAAQQLSLTQPAVSNAVRRLREALGDELLVRQGRALVPTGRALALWPAVRSVLDTLQDSLAPSVFDPSLAHSTFVLTLADSTAAELMPPLVEAIAAQAPGVSLRVVPLTTRDPRKMLQDGQADLAIGHFPALVADLGDRSAADGSVPFMHQRLFEGDYVCVMRHGHPLARQELTLEHYCAARHMLVSFSGRAYGFVDEALASLQKSRRVVLTVNQFFTAGRVAVQSDLLAVLPRRFVGVTGFADQLLIRELPFRVPPIQVDAVWHPRHQGSGAHAWLRDLIAALADKAFLA